MATVAGEHRRPPNQPFPALLASEGAVRIGNRCRAVVMRSANCRGCVPGSASAPPVLEVGEACSARRMLIDAAPQPLEGTMKLFERSVFVERIDAPQACWIDRNANASHRIVQPRSVCVVIGPFIGGNRPRCRYRQRGWLTPQSSRHCQISGLLSFDGYWVSW